MRTISVADIEHLAFRLAREILSFNEPIPDFHTRYPNALESCVATPFQMFGKRYLYPSLAGKAGIFFYLMVKNHPFQNGNKRIAMTSLMTFLYLNKKWLKVDVKDFYEFAMFVAQSSPKSKDWVVKSVKLFIEEHLIDL
jgi:death-on-curing family protein